MGVYTPTGSFTDGGSPGVSAAFLNNVENAIVAGGMIYFLGTPYHLTTNPTVTSGTTTTLTCTGVGSIPSGAKGVLLGISINCGTANAFVTLAPHGGTLGQYFGFTGPIVSQFMLGFGICPLDVTGKIDVHANSGNIVLQDWYIFGYIM